MSQFPQTQRIEYEAPKVFEQPSAPALYQEQEIIIAPQVFTPVQTGVNWAEVGMMAAKAGQSVFKTLWDFDAQQKQTTIENIALQSEDELNRLYLNGASADQVNAVKNKASQRMQVLLGLNPEDLNVTDEQVASQAPRGGAIMQRLTTNSRKLLTGIDAQNARYLENKRESDYVTKALTTVIEVQETIADNPEQAPAVIDKGIAFISGELQRIVGPNKKVNSSTLSKINNVADRDAALNMYGRLLDLKQMKSKLEEEAAKATGKQQEGEFKSQNEILRDRLQEYSGKLKVIEERMTYLNTKQETEPLSEQEEKELQSLLGNYQTLRLQAAQELTGFTYGRYGISGQSILEQEAQAIYSEEPFMLQNQTEYRPDGSKKSVGWIPGLTNSRGEAVTEYSVEVDGKLIPLINPYLSREELNEVVAASETNSFPSETIIQKSVRFAEDQQAQGQSPFFDLPYPLKPIGLTYIAGTPTRFEWESAGIKSDPVTGLLDYTSDGFSRVVIGETQDPQVRTAYGVFREQEIKTENSIGKTRLQLIEKSQKAQLDMITSVSKKAGNELDLEIAKAEQTGSIQKALPLLSKRLTDFRSLALDSVIPLIDESRAANLITANVGATYTDYDGTERKIGTYEEEKKNGHPFLKTFLNLDATAVDTPIVAAIFGNNQLGFKAWEEASNQYLSLQKKLYKDDGDAGSSKKRFQRINLAERLLLGQDRFAKPETTAADISEAANNLVSKSGIDSSTPDTFIAGLNQNSSKGVVPAQILPLTELFGTMLLIAKTPEELVDLVSKSSSKLQDGKTPLLYEQSYWETVGNYSDYPQLEVLREVLTRADPDSVEYKKALVGFGLLPERFRSQLESAIPADKQRQKTRLISLNKAIKDNPEQNVITLISQASSGGYSEDTIAQANSRATVVGNTVKATNSGSLVTTDSKDKQTPEYLERVQLIESVFDAVKKGATQRNGLVIGEEEMYSPDVLAGLEVIATEAARAYTFGLVGTKTKEERQAAMQNAVNKGLDYFNEHYYVTQRGLIKRKIFAKDTYPTLPMSDDTLLDGIVSQRTVSTQSKRSAVLDQDIAEYLTNRLYMPANEAEYQSARTMGGLYGLPIEMLYGKSKSSRPLLPPISQKQNYLPPSKQTMFGNLVRAVDRQNNALHDTAFKAIARHWNAKTEDEFLVVYNDLIQEARKRKGGRVDDETTRRELLIVTAALKELGEQANSNEFNSKEDVLSFVRRKANQIRQSLIESNDETNGDQPYTFVLDKTIVQGTEERQLSIVRKNKDSTFTRVSGFPDTLVSASVTGLQRKGNVTDTQLVEDVGQLNLLTLPTEAIQGIIEKKYKDGLFGKIKPGEPITVTFDFTNWFEQNKPTQTVGGTTMTAFPRTVERDPLGSSVRGKIKTGIDTWFTKETETSSVPTINVVIDSSGKVTVKRFLKDAKPTTDIQEARTQEPVPVEKTPEEKTKELLKKTLGVKEDLTTATKGDLVFINDMVFKYEDNKTLRELYVDVYGEEGADLRLQQATQRQRENPMGSNFAVLPDYQDTDETQIFRYANPNEEFDLSARGAAIRTSDRNSPTGWTEPIITLARRAGPDVSLHEGIHSAQEMSGVSVVGSMFTDEEFKAMDKESKYVLSKKEIPAWFAELKANYYLETKRELLPNSPQKDYNEFLGWLEQRVNKKKNPWETRLFELLTESRDELKKAANEVLRQVAMVGENQSNIV